MFKKLKSSYFIIKANKAYASGDNTGVLNWLERAYKTGAAKSNVVTTYGYMLLKSGKLEEAMKIFEEHMRSPKISNNELYDVQANYALGLWKQGKLDEAITLLEKVISKYKNTNIYGSLGYLYNLKGDLEKALSFNLEALDYNSSGAVIVDNLGQTYFLLGDQDKAIETFKKLMELNPKFPEAYYDYALVLDKQGDTEKSIEMLKKAQEFKTNYLSVIAKEDIDSKLTELQAR